MGQPIWRYQVDESRKRKHHWNQAHAGFVREGGEVVGKCPATLTAEEAEVLLNAQGVPWNNPRLAATGWPDCIYVVHQGVIYKAVPTIAGISYHAFPELPERLRRLPKALRERIMLVAERLGCQKEAREWIDR